MDRQDLDYIADLAGGWMARPNWEDARKALREGKILPPKFMLAAASKGNREAARACVEWVWHAQKIEYSKEAMKIIAEDERERQAIERKREKAERKWKRKMHEARAEA